MNKAWAREWSDILDRAKNPRPMTDERMGQIALEIWNNGVRDLKDIVRMMTSTWEEYDLKYDKIGACLKRAWRKQHPRGNYPHDLAWDFEYIPEGSN